MAIQFVFLFICVFLTTNTLGIDYATHKLLNHHEKILNPVHHLIANQKQANNHQPDNRHHQLHHSVFLHNSYQNRDGGDNEQCGWVCPSQPDTNGCDLYFNQTTHYLGILNVTAEVAIVFDVSTGSAILFNGQKGLTIVIDIQSQIIIETSYSIQTSTIVWLASEQSFELFFRQLVTIREIIEISRANNGQTSNISNPNQQILTEIVIIISQLEINIIGGAGGDGSLILNVLIKLSQSFVRIYRSSLRILLIKIRHIHLTFGVQKLNDILQGIVELLDSIQGGPQIVINGTISIDIILRSNNNSLEIFVNFLKQIGDHSDLAVVLGNILNNPVRLLRIIVELGGNSTVGIEGFFNVLYNIAGVIHNQVPVQNLINILIRVAQQGRLYFDPIDLDHFIRLFIQLIDSQNSRYHNRSGLDGLIKFLESLSNSTQKPFGLDFSGIIQDLEHGKFRNPIEFIIRIFIEIGKAIDPTRIFSQFFSTLIGLLNSTQGVEIVSQLIPGLNLSQITADGGLQSILNGTQITQLLNGTGDISSLISRIPIIGNIYLTLSQLIQSNSHGSLNLENLLNSSLILSNLEGLIGGGGSGNNPISSIISEIGGGIHNFTSGILSGIKGIIGWPHLQGGGSFGGSSGGNGGSSNGGNGGTAEGGAGGSAAAGGNGTAIGGNGGTANGGDGGISVGGDGGVSGTINNNNNGNHEATFGWSWSNDDRKIHSANKHRLVHVKKAAEKTAKHNEIRKNHNNY